MFLFLSAWWFLPIGLHRLFFSLFTGIGIGFGFFSIHIIDVAGGLLITLTNYLSQIFGVGISPLLPKILHLVISTFAVVWWWLLGEKGPVWLIHSPLPLLSRLRGRLVGSWSSICKPHGEWVTCNQLGIFYTVVHPRMYRNSLSYIKICFKIGQGCQNLPLLNR